jgi:prophage DNA circulation protein
MFKHDVEEAVPILRIVIDRLLKYFGSPPPATDQTMAAQFRAACGRLAVDAEVLLYNDAAGEPLAECFELARQAGATIQQMTAFRDDILVATDYAVTVGGILVRNCSVRFSLATEGRIIADMTFRTREEVEQWKQQINSDFAAAEEVAADDMDAMSYRYLVQLHAAVTFYLIETQRPLPRMLQYRFSKILPSLALSYRLYADAGRADEIKDENRIVHPAFCGLSGRALSA